VSAKARGIIFHEQITFGLAVSRPGYQAAYRPSTVTGAGVRFLTVTQ
jgi:hypothetical protein